MYNGILQIQDYITYLLKLHKVSEWWKLSDYERIQMTKQYIFDFDYPIFDESYRDTFETNFLFYFLYDSIGSETISMFKTRLEGDLRLYMTTFNQWYKAFALLKIDDILTNYKQHETLTREQEKDDTMTTDTTNTSTSLNSQFSYFVDTPQQTVGSDFNHMTNKTLAESTAEGDGEQIGNTIGNSVATETYVLERWGNSGVPYATLVRTFVDALINVDLLVYNQLSNNFLQVYDI